MFSIDGLVTGLDTTKIIGDLLAARQAQVDRLNLRKQEIINKQTAFKGIEGKLLALKSALSSLTSARGDTFSVRNVTSSNESLVTAAATKDAAIGNYRLRVNQLARAEQVVSVGVASPETVIQQGTFSIRVGSRSTKTITIDSQNNTLEGLVNAINNSGADASASIINENGTSRILLSSKFTGAANDIFITNQLNTGPGVAPDFSGPLLQDGTDAQVILGQGTGEITISSDKNLISNVFQGITLNLNAANANEEISLNVTQDIQPAVDNIKAMVDSYNDVMAYIDEQTKFEQATGKAGTLLGVSAANDVQRDLRSELARVLSNLPTNLNRLSSIGIRFDDKGRLQLDQARLQKVLKGEVAGVRPEDAQNLFTLSGKSSDSNIRFLLGTSQTKESTTPYDVVITQTALRGKITGTTPLDPTTVITATTSFVIEVNHAESETLELQAGTYTQQELANHIQAVINNSSKLSGRPVNVTVENNYLKIESDSFGASSNVKLVSGDLTKLGLATGQTGDGRDVAGYFLVDGETELASGKGRVLSGTTLNANTSGIQLQVNLTDSQVSGEHHSDLSITRGFASRLNQLIDQLLDGTQGRLTTVDNSFQRQISSVDKSVERVNKLVESQRDRLIKEFAALESTVNSLRSTSNFLASQLGGVSALATS